MKERVEYIDAMRGLAMLMVVIFHISYGCFHSNNIITSITCAQIQLPLFFMISGFFAGRMMKTGVRCSIRKRFISLVIPSLLMLFFYCEVKNIPYLSALGKMLKEGYWFALVLFEFVVIYLYTAMVLRCLRVSEICADIIHVIVGVVMIYVASFSEHYNASYPILDVFTVTYFGLYFYYALGSVMFKRLKWLYNALNDTILMGGGILAWLILEIVRYRTHFMGLGLFTSLALTIHTSLALIIILYAFEKYKPLSEGNRISRFLGLMGRRSLDVYFIHYFLLPYNMAFVGEYFAPLNIPFVEYLLAIVLAVPLSLASLAIGSLLRLSPLTSRLLLGAKN